MAWARSGRARISRSNPEARGVCDRCGFMYSLSDLRYQYQWAGTQLQNLMLRVCDRCMDIPQEQLRSIILPPDPIPVTNPRQEYYSAEVTSFLQTVEGPTLLTEDGQAILWEITITPTPNPNNSYLSAPST